MSAYYTIIEPTGAVSSAAMLHTVTAYANANNLKLAAVEERDTLHLYSRCEQLTQHQVLNAPIISGWEMRILTRDIMTMNGRNAMTVIEYSNAMPF